MQKLRQKQLDEQERAAGSGGTAAAPAPAPAPKPKRSMSYSDFFFPKQTPKATPYRNGGMVKGRKGC